MGARPEYRPDTQLPVLLASRCLLPRQHRGREYLRHVVGDREGVATGAGVHAVRAAWAGLAGAKWLTPLQVLVQPESALCPPGWVGVLRIDGTITAAVPDERLQTIVSQVLGQLDPWDATDPDVVTGRLPKIVEVLGPASLFYALTGIRAVEGLRTVDLDDVLPLLKAVSPADLKDSGLAKVTSPLCVEGDVHGSPIAACGYRHWPYGIAHLSVLVHPKFRGRGLARRVATGAIARALDEGLLPQWRAGGESSKGVARRLALTEVGAQLSVRLRA